MAIKTVPLPHQRNVAQTGAQAFIALMQNIKVISDATCVQGNEASDARDYRSIAALIESSIRENISTAMPTKHQEGYFRALADLLTLSVDGCAPGEKWNPLQATSKAFGDATTLRSV